MRSLRWIFCYVMIFGPATASLAYEVDTHADLSRAAIDITSLVGTPATVKNLALDIEDVDTQFLSSKGRLNIVQLIRLGAKSEDDLARPITHFFNPRNGEGAENIGPPSPSWALEDDRSYDAWLIFKILTLNLTLEIQNYSLIDAHEYLYDALTLEEPQERRDQAALFFETLGRVIHHVQDMAQPQHTRDDAHFTDGIDFTNLPIEDPSLHERWTNINLRHLPLDQGYPIPEFPTPREFWTTNQTTEEGRGMADYSNAGFVSADTNFGNPVDPPNSDYPTPHVDNAEGWWVPDVRPLFTENKIEIPSPCLDPQTPCEMWFLRTLVQDKLNQGLNAYNDFTSTSSMFDDELEKRNLKKTYSLNRFNYFEANKFLIPRAVSYSAGLVDFVFRGKLTVEAAEQRSDTVVLKVVNESADGTAFSDGTFRLLYDDPSGSRNPVSALHVSGALDADLVGSLDSGESVELEATMPPDATGESRFVLVYRGTIGQSAGIASVSFKVEPYRTGFAVSLPGGAAGYISWKDNQWNFISDSEIEAGNIDWRGAYVNGKPTKTLTWSGPTSRYFDGGQKLFTFKETIGEWRPSTFRPYVYENGRLLAAAPGPVLGAAIMQGSLGEEWLVVVTSLGPLKRIVYRRPNERSNSAALYDPVNNPTGWREMGQISAPTDEPWIDPRSPWFFNGNGTAAQAMETIALAEDELPPAKLVRIELRISDDEISWINHGNLNNEAHWVSLNSECTSNYTEEYPDVFGSASSSSVRSGRTIIAVDYLDDQELLAVMHAEGATSAEDLRDTRINQIDSSTRNEYQEWLIIGANRFDLSEVDIFQHFVVTEGGGGSYQLERFSRTSQIRYMDLREVVLQLVESTSSIDSIDERSPPGLRTDRTSSREVIKKSDSLIITMDEESTVTQSPLNPGTGPFSCPSPSLPQIQLRPFTNYWPLVEIVNTCPLCVPEISFFSSSYVGLHGSVAIDGSGRIFSSQDILRIPPLPNVTSNFLFGAPGESPSFVIGVGEDDKTLYEPRVIR